MLLRPKTQLKDMTIELNKGTPGAGRCRAAAPPGLADRAGREPRRAARRARRRHALLPAGADRLGRARAWRVAADLSAACAASTRRARLRARSPRSCCRATSNIARVHNLALLIAALGDKDTELAQAGRASNAVFGTFAQEHANFADAAAARRARQDQTGSASSPPQPACWGRLASFAVAQALAPPPSVAATLVQDDDAGDQEPDLAVRARGRRSSPLQPALKLAGVPRA